VSDKDKIKLLRDVLLMVLKYLIPGYPGGTLPIGSNLLLVDKIEATLKDTE
jgi:hypothetical protein